MSQKVSDFKAVKLQLASPEQILSWSSGEVLKPETINYRTQRFEKDGLFCERIFGPSKDWECYCGKYKRIRYKGIICDKCGVEVTRSIVRRERMGHISLAVPVSHIWFLRGVSSRLGLVLNINAGDLERVIYFANYIVISVNEEEKASVLIQINREYKTKKEEIKKSDKTTKEKKEAEEKLKKIFLTTKGNVESLKIKKVISEVEYRRISLKYGHIFEAGIGAEAIRKILINYNLKEEIARAENVLQKGHKGIDRKKIIKRLRLIKGLEKANLRPEWMLPTVVPVIPPDLRPMVQLEGGRFATSDLNDLYRRIINRNNRLKKLLSIGAPEVICRNEKRMLQEAVDALFDNSARKNQVSVAASTGQKRPLKSLADMLKGKQGRFRQNLLGKRVDYSGRSVIVVGANLRIDQCGLPKEMALELFKPFIIEKLIKRELAHNVRSAGRLVDQKTTEAYEILEQVIEHHYVILNRAPTLHRLGIQAFSPVLVEGKAIQIHPMVCTAFNADFDGDQMAVHVPLTEKAKWEAENIMVSKKNLLKPSTGEPITTPTQDIVLGIYSMTGIKENKGKAKKKVESFDDAILLYQMEKISAKEEILVMDANGNLIETTVGRIFLNRIISKRLNLPFINRQLNKKDLKRILMEVLKKGGMEEVAELIDELKKLGFKFATFSGISWGLRDIKTPKGKDKHIKEAEGKIIAIGEQYNSGLLTDTERRSQVVQTWNECRENISKEVEKEVDPKGPVFSMIDSGARGTFAVLTQLTGMRGLMANPRGEIIELPVRNSFKEGLNVLEYFISSHGTRKGMADTALRTATAGYLTRRLVDVAQDVIISEEDCGSSEGVSLYKKDTEEIGGDFAYRIEGKMTLKDVINPKTKEIIVEAGQIINKDSSEKINELNIDSVFVRSAIFCKAKRGICRSCYGYDLGRRELVELGQAVGVIAAQSIGEPGTQLTMRTFHVGGVAGEDIVSGLPRVEEIFEARSPKGEAIISEVDGKIIDLISDEKQKTITIQPADTQGKKDRIIYHVALTTNILVEKGDLIAKGSQLTSGHLDLKKIYKISGLREVHRYVVKEIQGVYASQGESIDDKHLDIIVRQMFSRVKVIDSGDVDLVPGDLVEKNLAEELNRKAVEEGKVPAKLEETILGITKVSLSTDSFLSAASFQHTAQVLINASLQGKVDYLRGLKENVILGKLIPSGTGFKRDAEVK